MDKLQLTGQNPGRVFNFRSCHFHSAHLWRYRVKLPNLKLKTRPKQLLGSLPLDIAFPAEFHQDHLHLVNNPTKPFLVHNLQLQVIKLQ
jgi:hypothetical protein